MGMQVTELTICEVADLLTDSVEIVNLEQAALSCHILQHPELGNITVFQNSSGSGGGFLVRTCPTDESTHQHAQDILTRVY